MRQSLGTITRRVFSTLNKGIREAAIMTENMPAHQNCISGKYAGSDVERLAVPEDKVSWKTSWDDYKPREYTSEKLKKADYADPDISYVLEFFVKRL